MLRAMLALGVEHLIQEVSAATVAFCRACPKKIVGCSDQWISHGRREPSYSVHVGASDGALGA